MIECEYPNITLDLEGLRYVRIMLFWLDPCPCIRCAGSMLFFARCYWKG